jgi:hypothetical protein
MLDAFYDAGWPICSASESPLRAWRGSVAAAQAPGNLAHSQRPLPVPARPPSARPAGELDERLAAAAGALKFGSLEERSGAREWKSFLAKYGPKRVSAEQTELDHCARSTLIGHRIPAISC